MVQFLRQCHSEHSDTLNIHVQCTCQRLQFLFNRSVFPEPISGFLKRSIMVEALGIAEAGCYTGALAVHQQRQSTEGETTPISVSMRPCIFRAFRHCWPLHLDYDDEGTVWNRWKCSRMGDRLPQWQESNCLLWKGQFWRRNAAVRCPTEMVLGPRIFIQYAEDIAKLFSQHGLHHHLFADDVRPLQWQACRLSFDGQAPAAQHQRCQCLVCQQMTKWRQDRASLVRLCNASLQNFTNQVHNRQQQRHPPSDCLLVRDLGVCIYSELWMRDHVLLLSPASPVISTSSSQPWRLCQTGFSPHLVAPWLLQHCPRGFSRVDTYTVTESAARNSKTCTQPEAVQPCNCRPPRVALVSHHAANCAQTVYSYTRPSSVIYLTTSPICSHW